MPKDQDRVEKHRRVIDEVYEKMAAAGHKGSQGSGLSAGMEAFREVRRQAAGLAGPGPSSAAMVAAAAAGGSRQVITGVGVTTSATAGSNHGNGAAAGAGGPSETAPLSSAALLSAAALSASITASKRNSMMRCLCGVMGPRPVPPERPGQLPITLQCQGEACGFWQHTVCSAQVSGKDIPAIPQPPLSTLCARFDWVEASESPSPFHVQVPSSVPQGGVAKLIHERFYCEVCRSARADPFWEVVGNEIMPMALIRRTGKQVLVSHAVPKLTHAHMRH